MEITSVNNDLVKETVKLQQKKYRTQSGKFLLEGFKAIKEAFDFGIKLEHIFVDKNKIKEYEFAKDLVIETTEPVLKKLSTTESAPTAIAIGFQKEYNKNILKNTKKVLLLENIKDSGNLGTIVRSAVAFGADAIVLYGESVDIYNPKCVRSTVGNLWKIPIFHLSDFKELEELFGNYERIATLPRSKNLLKEYKIKKAQTLVLFGSEASGLTEKLINFSTNSLKIEMAKTVESLNLATSVSVILYELFV